MILVFVAFLALLLIGVPIAFALGLAGTVGILDRGLALVSVPSRMFTGIDSFILLSAPFYILAGELMNTSGVTNRIFSFSHALAGHIRGGFGHVNVIGSLIFAGISGSSAADAAGMGRVEIKAMVEERRQALIDGSFDYWQGPLQNNDGKEVVAAGQTLTIADINGMDWLVEGVVGKIPNR